MGCWARTIRTLLAIESHASSASSSLRAFRPRGRKLRIESLEDRALLTVSASFVDGHLAVASDWRDEIVVDVESGFVKVNGADLDIGPIAAADVTGLSIRGGLLSPLVDAAGTSGQLAVDGVSITIPSVAETIADFRAHTSLGPQIEAALASGALTQLQLDLIAAGQVTAEALQELSTAGIGQEWIDKGIEALDFFHAQDAADQSRQMVMSASVPDNSQTVYGTAGNDTLTGGDADQVFYGGQGNDFIDGGEGNDVIYGGQGDDYLDGGEGKSAFFGGSDDDLLIGGDGYDTWADGGEGHDTFIQDGENGSDFGAPPVVSIGNAALVENAGYASFTVTLNQSHYQDVSVAWQTVDGSAAAGSDYTASSGTLVIPVGYTSGTISVPVSDDALDETDEAFSVALSNPINATLGNSVGTATLYDNDTPTGNLPVVSINSAGPIAEHYGGAIFTVTLSQALGKTARVHYATGGGTAIAGTHYTATSGDLYFEPGATTKYVAVSWADDTTYEGSTSAPYFFVNLSSPLNTQIGTASGYAQITNDDPLPTLSIADTTVTEGDPGGAPVYATFTLSLTNAADFAITASVLLGPGTALTPADYTPLAAPYVVTIAAGQTFAQFLVPITADLVPEPTEEFHATISSANVTTTDWQGICTVLDDDPRINLSADVINMNVSAGVLSEALEETVGAYVPLNDDDDDYDPLHLPDKDQQDPLVFGENDLLPITLQKVDPLASGGQYTLTIPSNVRVWTHDDRSVQVTSSTTFSAAADTRLYVEGLQVGSGILRINWSNGLKTINDADRVTINVFKMNGPLNVPGYAIYEYTAFGGRPDDSGWLGSDQATTQININDDAATGLDYIDVLWGSGPYVGELAYKASTDYVWKLDVNVVEVRIKPGDADNINHMFYADAQGDPNHTPPIPANPPLQIQGTAIIKSSSQFGDDAMKSLITVETIVGPTVAGSERGKSFLEIGYLQTGRVGSKQAMFPSPQGIWVRRSSFAPAEAPHLESIDAAAGSTLPWYDSGNVLAGQAVPFNYPRTPHGMLAPADNVAYNDVEFWTIDNPRLTATDTPQIITPGSPLQILAASDYVVSVVFATYLGVRSKEAKPDRLGNLSDTIYTQRTKAAWSFVAAGQVVGASNTSFGVWTFAEGGVDGDFSPEVVTSGDRVSFTDQQPLNVLGSTTNESWTNDAP